jgi:hypothetical protein
MPSNQVNLKKREATPQKGLSARFFRWSETPLGQRLLENWRAVAEIVLLAIFFALAAGQRAPDVNESHYLCKAKHFWDQSYCPGDIFLSSSFSHLAFYVSTGWLTKLVSLSTYAWIGRIATWIFLAAGWRAICKQLFSVPLISAVTGIFFVILNERLHLAGEWVVGGFEAKGIAYGFVLFAIASLLKRNWQWVWPLLGCASAFHVLVGGWATIAAGACLLYSMVAPSVREPGGSVSFGQIVKIQAVPLLIGFLIALVGILPPLMAESFSPHKAAANAVYVNERVAHHVNFSSFPIAYVGRFAILILLWQVFSRWFYKSGFLDRTLFYRVKMLEVFALMTLVFSFAGLLLSGLAEQGGDVAVFANQFLRFYCFRLADVAVPASLALVTGCILSRWISDRGDFPHQVCSGIFMGCILVAGATMVQENHADGRPNADVRTLRSDPIDAERTGQIYRNWRKACGWISKNTDHDAVFITPAQQQTFKWYAGRTEVCCWKDVPQDPDTMAKWRKRIQLLVEPQRESDLGVFVYSDEQIWEMAGRFGATHLLTLQQSAELISEPTGFKQVYPADPKARTTFAVFELVVE